MTHGLYGRLNSALERAFPEQRLFLKSSSRTRFVRLRPVTQAVTLTGGAAILGWSIFASAILIMDTIGAGNLREQAQREQAAYEERLNDLADRARRTGRGCSARAAAVHHRAGAGLRNAGSAAGVRGATQGAGDRNRRGPGDPARTMADGMTRWAVPKC